MSSRFAEGAAVERAAELKRLLQMKDDELDAARAEAAQQAAVLGKQQQQLDNLLSELSREKEA